MDSAWNDSRAVRARMTSVAGALGRFLPALVALTKPKILLASVLTALATYVFVGDECSLAGVLALLGASGMAAAGSLAFNQWWERDSDPLMRRTRSRPLPRGSISPGCALAWSLILSLGGCLWLLAAFGGLASGLGAATVVLYAGLYTPMKSRSRWATEIGALSGALPPLLGAAAAGNPSSMPAWFLAGALFLWQMPHFFSIGWIHRADYRAARLPLLPATDPDGRRTAQWSLAYVALLTLLLLILWSTGLTPAWGGGIALSGSLWMLIRAWKFYTATDDRTHAAKRLFRATLLALPAILCLLLRLPK